jgi:hypothetical protein
MVEGPVAASSANSVHVFSRVQRKNGVGHSSCVQTTFAPAPTATATPASSRAWDAASWSA